MKLTPLGNPNLFQIMVGDLLTPEECQRLRHMLRPDAWSAAAVTNKDHPGGVIDAYSRSVLGQEVPLLADGWPMTRIRDVVSEVNDRVWRYDLVGFVGHDYPNVLRYEAGVNDHFHNHNDVGPTNPTRKISFSVQLCPADSYLGSELLFNGTARDPRMRQEGIITMFPSMLFHEVTPIIQGVRDTIVGWVHGPTYR